MPLELRQALGALGWVSVTLAAAAIGAVASSNAPSFYGELARPAWAPPASVFGPVWTLLYAAMAVAAWWIWRARGFAGARTALVLFLVQLAVNALWSWLFFAWHLGAVAFVDVALLLGLVIATTVAFYRVSKLAAALLYPYAVWCAYAAALTFAVWQLNPGKL